MAFRYDTYCGLYCGACPVLLANETDRVESAAKSWNMDPENLRCHGCKSDTNAVYCVDCEIKDCAENRDVDACSRCEEYPCPLLTQFRDDEHSHHSVVIRNLDFIRKRGIDTWLDKQGNRWRCPTCGEKFSWYETSCTMCEDTLYSCVDEEKDILGEKPQ